MSKHHHYREQDARFSTVRQNLAKSGALDRLPKAVQADITAAAARTPNPPAVAVDEAALADALAEHAEKGTDPLADSRVTRNLLAGLLTQDYTDRVLSARAVARRVAVLVKHSGVILKALDACLADAQRAITEAREAGWRVDEPLHENLGARVLATAAAAAEAIQVVRFIQAAWVGLADLQYLHVPSLSALIVCDPDDADLAALDNRGATGADAAAAGLPLSLATFSGIRDRVQAEAEGRQSAQAKFEAEQREAIARGSRSNPRGVLPWG